MACPVCLHEEHLPSCNWAKMHGPFIRTYTKKFVNPLDLKPEDIDIEDIAHHLACINRFVGALRTPVSVGQHSVGVSRLIRGWAGPEYGLYGLLHDASEAYLGDVSKWVKSHPDMQAYRDAEERAERAIYERFGLTYIDMSKESGAILERADRLMVRVEGQLGFDVPELLPGNDRYGAVTDEEWTDVQDLVGPRFISEMDWRNVKLSFMMEYRELTRIK